MEIALFGASSRTGRALMSLAAAKGVAVRAFVRDPLSIDSSDSVSVFAGSLDDQAAVSRAIDGVTAVCCVFGPRPPYSDIFCAAANETIISCMLEANVGRIVCQTGAMVGHYPANRTFPMRLMERAYRRKNPAAARDRDQQEESVMRSALDWTLAKPPRLRTAGSTGWYSAGPSLRVGLLSSLRREDLAVFLLDVLIGDRSMGEAVFLKSV